MIPIAKDKNNTTRRLKIIFGLTALTIMKPFAMIKAIGTLNGPSRVDCEYCEHKNELWSYW